MDKALQRAERVQGIIKAGDFIGLQFAGCEMGMWRQKHGCNPDTEVLLWEVVNVGRLAVTLVCKTGSMDLNTSLPYTALWDTCHMGTVADMKNNVNTYELTKDQLLRPLYYVNLDW